MAVLHPDSRGQCPGRSEAVSLIRFGISVTVLRTVIGAEGVSIAEAVLAELDAEDRDEIETLLAYDPETAGGLMQTEL